MRAAANGFARPLSAVTPRAPVAAAPAALQMALAAVRELNPGGQRGRSVEAGLSLPVLDPAGHVEVDRDICFLLNAFAIEPGSATPRVMTMLGSNLWC